MELSPDEEIPRDIVGELRVVRFLRFQNGDEARPTQAAAMYGGRRVRIQPILAVVVLKGGLNPAPRVFLEFRPTVYSSASIKGSRRILRDSNEW